MGQLFQAVIGSNFGDEGKGRTVDYLCSQAYDPLVIRHNSGAQAGHTVEIGSSRHIHQHFGSGTMRGAPTLLMHRFVVNPLAFNREWEELEGKGITPTVYIDENCIVTTPLDIMLNQMTEIARGADRHGSCGMGFGETLERHENLRGPKIRVKNCDNFNIFDASMWFVARIVERNIEREPLAAANWPGLDTYDKLMQSQFNWARWVEEVELMRKRAIITRRADLVIKGKNVIFEGAQGLMLHQKHEFFPHVTRSNTGLEDIIELIKHTGFTPSALHAFYCSRTYLTRHGNGPLPGELPQKPYESIVDLTNQSNEWQGSLRFAHYNRDLTFLEIMRDIERSDVSSVNKFSWSYALNCADQVPSSVIDNTADLIGWGADSAETEDKRPSVNRPSRRTVMGGTPQQSDLNRVAPPPAGTDTVVETASPVKDDVSSEEGDSGLGADQEAETAQPNG